MDDGLETYGSLADVDAASQRRSDLNRVRAAGGRFGNIQVAGCSYTCNFSY
ncbi:MAG: hypothetical protein IPI67_19655 [Myxococcales bacterium]|nr:hypothetical protein [Myxococcales bacterium]